MAFGTDFPIDPKAILIIIQLIFLEGILSIDNAAVLGAMVSVLPDDKPVPYPRPLHFLQDFTDRVLGMQRMAALKVGLLGAYLGRGLMLLLASYVIQNPWLRLVGAAYLIKLAFEHLPPYAFGASGDPGVHAAEESHVPSRSTSFWSVVLSVELADLAFSLDNVVAAVGLSEELWVVMLGVALGIVMMRFAAGIFTHLIEREPILAPAAYLLVLNIGIELILEDFQLVEFNEWMKFAISITTLILAIVYAHSPFLQRMLRPILQITARGMIIVNEGINRLLSPIGHVLKALFRAIADLLGVTAARGPDTPEMQVAANPSPAFDSAKGDED